MIRKDTMHKRSCDVQGLCDGFLKTQRCRAWVELLFSISTFIVFPRKTPKTRLQWWCCGEKSTQYSFPLTQNFLIHWVSSSGLTASQGSHHSSWTLAHERSVIIIFCIVLCVERCMKSLFDIAHWLQEQTVPFESPSGARLWNSTSSGSTELHNPSSPAQAIHCTYCLTHCLLIVISGSVFGLIAER